MENKSSGYIYLIAFALSIPAANYMIGNVGTFCVPDGPCLIPVAPGITAPSGVLMVGLALVLRDLVQRSLGFKWALGAVLLEQHFQVCSYPGTCDCICHCFLTLRTC